MFWIKNSILSGRGTDPYALYQYTPSLIAVIVAVTAFAISTGLHIYQVISLKSKYFIPFVIGLVFETIGYAGRAWSHYYPNALPPYIMQSLLILIAPAMFAASIYMVLGRIIARLDGEAQSLIPLRWLTKIFVIGDCGSFFIQCMGGGIEAGGTLQLLHLGEKIIVAGLLIQIVMFGFFIMVALIFDIRYRRSGNLVLSTSLHWQKMMAVLYLISAIILLRSIFRIVEYLMGSQGWILQHEFMLYIFDTLLMFSVAVIFYVAHPGRFFTKSEHKQAETAVGLIPIESV